MQVPRKTKIKKNDNEMTPQTKQHHAGTMQFEARQGRERTNSEETAMILTSMCMSSASSAPSEKTPLENNANLNNQIKIEDGTDEDETLIDPGTKYIPSMARFEAADRAKYISSYAKFKDEDDAEGWSSDGSESIKRRNAANAANRMKYHATKFISIEELREHFDQPIVEVARFFGICITLMKKVCRRNGIKRWPHRQIRSLTKSISSMEAAMMTATGAEREKYEGQIQTLKMKRDAVIADPNKEVSVSLSKCEFKEGKKDDLDETGSLSSDSGQKNSAAAAKDDTPPFILPATRPRPPPQQYEAKGGRWTAQEHAAFLEGIKLFGKNWRRVAQVVGTRNAVQTRTHAQKYLLKTSAHLELHLALLKKDGAVDEEVGLEEEANAAVLTSLTQGKPIAPAPSPPHDVEAGMDRLSSLMLKAESMHSHLLESADTIRSPLDALNFSAPLLLSPRWNTDKPATNGNALRKLALGRKQTETEDNAAKKRKVQLASNDGENENMTPNKMNVREDSSKTVDMPAPTPKADAPEVQEMVNPVKSGAGQPDTPVIVDSTDQHGRKDTHQEAKKETPTDDGQVADTDIQNEVEEAQLLKETSAAEFGPEI